MKHRSYCLALAISLTLVALPGTGQAQRTGAPRECPAVDPSGSRQVMRAMTQERLAWFRRKYGLTGVNVTHFRVLTDQNNAPICAKLNAYYAKSIFSKAPWKRSYYALDGIYFASFIDTTNPKTGPVHLSHFAVFDGALHLTATLSPR